MRAVKGREVIHELVSYERMKCEHGGKEGCIKCHPPNMAKLVNASISDVSSLWRNKRGIGIERAKGKRRGKKEE